MLGNRYYYISNNSRKNIYKTKKDFNYFIDTTINNLVYYSGIKLLSYCVLYDGYDFIIKTDDIDSVIGKFVRNIQITYIKYYRKIYKNEQIDYDKKVFEKKFIKILLNNQKDYKFYENFIHYKPIEKKIVKDIAKWPYSSLHQIKNTGFKNDDSLHINIFY